MATSRFISSTVAKKMYSISRPLNSATEAVPPQASERRRAARSQHTRQNTPKLETVTDHQTNPPALGTLTTGRMGNTTQYWDPDGLPGRTGSPLIISDTKCDCDLAGEVSSGNGVGEVEKRIGGGSWK